MRGIQSSLQSPDSSSRCWSDVEPNGPLRRRPRRRSSRRAQRHSNPNPMLFPKDARPYGRTLSRWAELTWSYIYSVPVDQNPVLRHDRCELRRRSGRPGVVPRRRCRAAALERTSRGAAPSRGNSAIMLQMSSAGERLSLSGSELSSGPRVSRSTISSSGQSRPLFDGVTGFTVVTLDGVEHPGSAQLSVLLGRVSSSSPGSQHGGVRFVRHRQKPCWVWSTASTCSSNP